MEKSGKVVASHVTKLFRRPDELEVLSALEDVSLTIESGSFVSIVGPSGCGKSTFIRSIAGLEHPTAGTIECDGETVTGTNKRRGMVFQDHSLFPWLTVWGNITFGLKSIGEYKEKKDFAEQLLKLVGLEQFRNSYPSQLSGGMSQRVALVRALVTKPDVLLLDEPLGALDAFTRMNIQDVLIELWKEQKNTMIMVTHDVDEAIYLSQKVIVMSARPGKIMKTIDIEMGYPRNRSHSQFVEYRNMVLRLLDYAHDDYLGEFII